MRAGGRLVKSLSPFAWPLPAKDQETSVSLVGSLQLVKVLCNRIGGGDVATPDRSEDAAQRVVKEVGIVDQYQEVGFAWLTA